MLASLASEASAGRLLLLGVVMTWRRGLLIRTCGTAARLQHYAVGAALVFSSSFGNAVARPSFAYMSLSAQHGGQTGIDAKSRLRRLVPAPFWLPSGMQFIGQ